MAEMMAHARSTDPCTSHEAARAIEPHLTEIQARVLEFAHNRRHYGFTDVELSTTLGDKTSTLRTRRAELVASNLIVDSGRRRTFDSPRKRIVWVHREFADEPPPIVIPERPERSGARRRRFAIVIAKALWGPACAELYFDPRYDRSPDVRRGQALAAADAVIALL